MIDKTVTLAEAGWKRIDGSTMRWAGELREVPFGDQRQRDFLEFRIRTKTDDPEKRPLLILESAVLDEDEDPDDPDVLENTMFSTMIEMPMPAAAFLHTMLGFVVEAQQ